MKMNTPIRLGNIYNDNHFGGSFGGTVWSKDGVSPTLETAQGGNRQPLIVASRGRGDGWEQQLEVSAQDYTNSLTTVQKDNMILEPQLLGGIGEKKSNGGTQYYQQDRVYSTDEIAMAHPASIPEGSYKYMVEEKHVYRIRKLTPRECFRLMGVKDEDYDKLTVSDTQKYKQAGNSIVVDVMQGIFENMFVKECKKNRLF